MLEILRELETRGLEIQGVATILAASPLSNHGAASPAHSGATSSVGSGASPMAGAASPEGVDDESDQTSQKLKDPDAALRALASDLATKTQAVANEKAEQARLDRGNKRNCNWNTQVGKKGTFLRRRGRRRLQQSK